MKLFRTLGFLLVSLALPASLALADENPAADIGAALVEMDAAIAVLAKLRPTPPTDEALMHLTRARIRLVEAARRVGPPAPAAQAPVNVTIKVEAPPAPTPAPVPAEPPRRMLPRAPDPISAAELADLIQSLKQIPFCD